MHGSADIFDRLGRRPTDRDLPLPVTLPRHPDALPLQGEVLAIEPDRLRGLIEASHLSVGGEFESHVLAMKAFVGRIQEILLELNREWEIARRALVQARSSLGGMSRGVANVGRELEAQRV